MIKICRANESRSWFSFRTIDRSVFKPIVQIAVIENSESIDCQLLAVTHAGKNSLLSLPLLLNANNWALVVIRY